METIFCPACGAEATSDDFACPSCESILNEAALEAEPISVVEALLSRSARKSKRPPPAAPAPRPEPEPAPAKKSESRPAVRPPVAPPLPPALMVPRLRGGIALTQDPLPPLEAELVSYIDGRATVAEIAARAKLSIIEVMVTLQAETLAGSVELTASAPPRTQEPATLVEKGSGTSHPAPPLPAPARAASAPLPKGLRLTAPSQQELRDGKSHRHVDPNIGSRERAVPERVDAFAVTQPEYRRSPVKPQPEEEAPLLGKPFLSYADDSDPSLSQIQAPERDARSSVQLSPEEDSFQARASLNADGQIVDAPPDTDATPIRTTPPRLALPPVVVKERVRAPPPADDDLAGALPPVPPARSRREGGPVSAGTNLGGRELELSLPEGSAPLELAREVRNRKAGVGQAYSDNRQTDSVLEQANALEREGDVAGAVELLEQAISTAPKPAALYNRLGLVMVKRADLPQAAALLRKAIALEPTNSIFRRNAEKIAELSAAEGWNEKGGKGRRGS